MPQPCDSWAEPAEDFPQHKQPEGIRTLARTTFPMGGARRRLPLAQATARKTHDGTDHIPNVENSRTMMFLLYAPSFVLRHHHFVLLDGIDRAVVCILGGARKAMS